VGRVHYAQAEAIPEGKPVMMGMFFVAKQPIVILFDSGASHTFINIGFFMKYQLPIEALEGSFCIQSPGGQIYTKDVVEHVPIDLVGFTYPIDLIILKGQDIDVILGMN